MPGELVTDEVDLYRLVFHPADFDKKTGKLKGAAFGRGDLLARPDAETGAPKYVSVDRYDLIDREAVDKRIAKMTDTDERRKNRRESKFAVLTCQSVIDCEHPIGEHPLEVREEMLEDNAAHCGIHNVSKDIPPEDAPIEEQDDYVNGLRNELLAAVNNNVKTYDQVFSPPAEDEPGAADS